MYLSCVLFSDTCLDERKETANLCTSVRISVSVIRSVSTVIKQFTSIRSSGIVPHMIVVITEYQYRPLAKLRENAGGMSALHRPSSTK